MTELYVTGRDAALAASLGRKMKPPAYTRDASTRAKGLSGEALELAADAFVKRVAGG